ncbi:translation initiation factor IF-2 [Desmodus rotundus]|uniref:translation initiation factor IF-2 n=1 Tax=Desmodus rotundus TaxID=9430 RepID=UPI0039E663D2
MARPRGTRHSSGSLPPRSSGNQRRPWGCRMGERGAERPLGGPTNDTAAAHRDQVLRKRKGAAQMIQPRPQSTDLSASRPRPSGSVGPHTPSRGSCRKARTPPPSWSSVCAPSSLAREGDESFLKNYSNERGERSRVAARAVPALRGASCWESLSPTATVRQPSAPVDSTATRLPTPAPPSALVRPGVATPARHPGCARPAPPGSSAHPPGGRGAAAARGGGRSVPPAPLTAALRRRRGGGGRGGAESERGGGGGSGSGRGGRGGDQPRETPSPRRRRRRLSGRDQRRERSSERRFGSSSSGAQRPALALGPRRSASPAGLERDAPSRRPRSRGGKCLRGRGGRAVRPPGAGAKRSGTPSPERPAAGAPRPSLPLRRRRRRAE